MPRIPCAFSVQEDFLRQIDARAAQLGMKRSEFILQALRKELLLNRGATMSIVADGIDPAPLPPPSAADKPYRIPRKPRKKNG